MAASKLHIFLHIFLVFALIFTLNKLTSKIHSLESLVDMKNQELKSKDEMIAHKDKIITSLKNDIASLEVKVSIDANEQVTKDYTCVHQSEKQSYAESHWTEHGKPAFESLKQKALEKKAQAERWAEPLVQTVKSKWIPAARERWVLAVTNVEPQLQSLTEKTKEVYVQSKDALTPHLSKIKEVVEPHLQLQSLTDKTKEVYIHSKDAITPHLSKIKEAVDPHFQTVKEVSEPYIDHIFTATKPHLDKARETVDHISTATKPHLDKARETVAPYTDEAAIAYGKFVESTTRCWKLMWTLVDRK